MERTTSLEEILAANPHVDRALLQQSMHVAQALAELGVKRPGYRLKSADNTRKARASSLLASPLQLHLVAR